MLKLALRRSVLLIATFLLAAGVSAEEEDELDESGFARRGFYIGVGGSAGWPIDLNSDFDNDLNEELTDLASEAEASSPSAR